MRIGIIGGGPAGCAAAVALSAMAKAKETAVDLTIIERQMHDGGRSFSQDTPALTLNTSAGVTSVDANDPDGFVRFLNQQRDAAPAEFAPRSDGAEYLRYALDGVDQRYCRIRHVRASASRVHGVSDGSLSVHTEGQQLTFDALVIATGAPFKNLFTAPSRSYGSPYQLHSQDGITKDSRVVIVGSSLSAVDACVSLHSSGHRGPITLLSRSGRLPAVRRSLLHEAAGHDFEAVVAERSFAHDISELELIGPVLTEHLGGTSTAAFGTRREATGTQEFLRACEESQAGVTPWERLMMSTIDILNRNWPTTGTRERSRFQLEVGTALNRYISAMPLENARLVESMMSSGQLRAFAGSLDYHGTPRLHDGTEIMAGAGSKNFIINATGLAPPMKDTLVASLQHEGLVSINKDGGIATCPMTGSAHDRYRLYALGPVAKGGMYTTNFLYSSARSAQTVAGAIFGVPAKQLTAAVQEAQ